jgi:hypothetical protein
LPRAIPPFEAPSFDRAIGTILGYIGQTLLIAVEHLAHGLAVLGVTNPIAAWLLLGGLAEATVGAVVGFNRIGMKKPLPSILVGGGVVFTLLLAFSFGAAKLRAS